MYVNATRFGDIRILAVERIQAIEGTDSSFEYPDDFNPEERLSESFGIVDDDPIKTKIRFSASQARYIKERRWAKEQKITDQEDGSILLEMTTSGWWDVKKWVLSHGAEAEVLTPEELRKKIMEELQMARAKYKGA